MAASGFTGNRVLAAIYDWRFMKLCINQPPVVVYKRTIAGSSKKSGGEILGGWLRHM